MEFMNAQKSRQALLVSVSVFLFGFVSDTSDTIYTINQTKKKT